MPRSIGLNSEASERTIPLARLGTPLPQRPARSVRNVTNQSGLNAWPCASLRIRRDPGIVAKPLKGRPATSPHSYARLPIRHLKSLSSEAARVLLRRTYVRPCGDRCSRASHYFAIRQPAYRRHAEREHFSSTERQRKTVRQTGRFKSCRRVIPPAVVHSIARVSRKRIARRAFCPPRARRRVRF